LYTYLARNSLSEQQKVAFFRSKPVFPRSNTYYGAEGGVLELLKTGAPYAPHV